MGVEGVDGLRVIVGEEMGWVSEEEGAAVDFRL